MAAEAPAAARARVGQQLLDVEPIQPVHPSRRERREQDAAVRGDSRASSAVAYDEDLANRIRELIGLEPGLTERKMFGGLAFLSTATWRSASAARVGCCSGSSPSRPRSWSPEPHARRFEMRGREMDGWLRVDPAGVKTKRRARAMGAARRQLRAIAAAQAPRLTRGRPLGGPPRARRASSSLLVDRRPGVVSDLEGLEQLVAPVLVDRHLV